jgi:hypothetical protein
MARTLNAVSVAAVSVVLSCTAILGDDFEIVGSGNGASASGGNGSGASGPGGSGVGGGALPPFECAWKPGTVREAISLQAAALPLWIGEVHAAMANGEMRVAIERAGGDFPGQVDIITMWGEAGPRSVPFIGDGVRDAVALPNDQVAVLYKENNLDGLRAYLTVIDNRHPTGEFSPTHVLAYTIFSWNDVQSAMVPLGPGGTVGDVALAVSYEYNGTRFGALASWLNDVTGDFFNFDSGAASAAEYALEGFVRKSNGNNVVFLGSVLDGASATRVFETPDITADSELDPVVTISDIFLGVRPRADGTFLVVYARPLANGTLEGRIGPVSEAELTTHTPDDLAVAGTFGSLSDYPRGGQPELTENSFTLVGNVVGTPELTVLVIHASGSVRINQAIPFPDPSLFPTNSVFFGAAHAIVSPNLFDNSGGDIMVAWVLESAGHHRLYYGELSCAVP